MPAWRRPGCRFSASGRMAQPLRLFGHVVRPDCDYVVVTAGDLPERHAFMSACSIDCAGVKAFKLAIPAAVGAEDTRWLHGLGLQIARTIRVWPAGMPGRNWDGEGRSEWLTTEQPCLALMHDHPVEAYALSIDRDGEQIIKAGNPGRPIYLKLPSLPVGSHLLTVRARRSGALEIASAPPEGHLQLSVREPEPWIPGVVSHAGMLIKTRSAGGQPRYVLAKQGRDVGAWAARPLGAFCAASRKQGRQRNPL